MTGSIVNPMETSYEIICAAERKDPRNAYFELLAHPAIIIPYTFKDEIAKMNNILRFRSASGYEKFLAGISHSLVGRL
jgi:hypothetical protein